jgi:lipid-A-disaccharide synthase
MNKTILVISGEESGDNHASALVRELKKLEPDLRLIGMGGKKLMAEGLEGIDSRPLSVVGFAEVVRKFKEIRRAFNALKARLDSEKVDLVLLVDYPGFNIRFAAEAKKRGIPVVYYISPQVWAWKAGRVKTLAKVVDKMLVVFPFEERIYRDAGVDVEFVGHPLVESAVSDKTKLEAKAALGYDKYDTVVALLPGSRKEELERMMPLFAAAADEVHGISRWRLKFIIPAAESIDDSFIETQTSRYRGTEFKIVRGRLNEALRASEAAIVTSGTATLETALLGVPMVIVYKLSHVSYVIGRLLVRLKHVGLPNIIANRRLVPELLQWAATPKEISGYAVLLLEDTHERDVIAAGYKEIREKLGEPGASARAARAVHKVLARAK